MRNKVEVTSQRPIVLPAQQAAASVNKFLITELGARALTAALDRGWIDQLAAGQVSRSELMGGSGLPEASFGLVWSLLQSAGIIAAGEHGALTPEFVAALEFRDLLEAKLWFANTVAPDIHQHFEALLSDLPRFMAEAKVFELFRYDRCFDVTPENIEATRRWVEYTTVLTRYEAPLCLDHLDLSTTNQMLDVGGNSGEFARQACARTPHLKATVFDLPVVCELGKAHVRSLTGGDRVSFAAGDLRAEALPGRWDMVSFKSVLHDWPESYAEQFLRKAWAALRPGGRLVIFERMPVTINGPVPYWMVANLVFLPFFRAPDFYLKVFDSLGATTAVQVLEGETAFQLIIARKPS